MKKKFRDEAVTSKVREKCSCICAVSGLGLTIDGIDVPIHRLNLTECRCEAQTLFNYACAHLTNTATLEITVTIGV